MKPLPDELLSSWLVRLSRAHGLKLNTFSRLVWSKSTIWNRDLDKSADGAFITIVQDKTGYSHEIIQKTLLSSYTSILYENHNPKGNTSWIMPLGIFHSTRTRHGLQICPLCLAEDSMPYYRKSWRLSIFTSCIKHRIELFDRCPKCNKPILFHRGEIGERDKLIGESFTLCSFCGLDWTSKESVGFAVLAAPDLLKFQKKITDAITYKWMVISPKENVHSVLFFRGLHQILKLLSFSSRGASLRRAVGRETGREHAQTFPNRVRSFEQLSINERIAIIRMAAWLLSNWPHNLTILSERHNISMSTLVSDCPEAPFWFLSVADFNFRRATYYPSNDEISAAISFLMREKKIITPKKVQSLIGSRDIFRKRNQDFIRATVLKMVRHNESLTPYNSLSERQRIAKLTCNVDIPNTKIALDNGIPYSLLNNIIGGIRRNGRISYPREFSELLRKYERNKIEADQEKDD